MLCPSYIRAMFLATCDQKSRRKYYAKAGIQDRQLDRSMIHKSKHWMLNMNNTLLTSFYRLLDCQIELKPSNKGHY